MLIYTPACQVLVDGVQVWTWTPAPGNSFIGKDPTDDCGWIGANTANGLLTSGEDANLMDYFIPQHTNPSINITVFTNENKSFGITYLAVAILHDSVGASCDSSEPAGHCYVTTVLKPKSTSTWVASLASPPADFFSCAVSFYYNMRGDGIETSAKSCAALKWPPATPGSSNVVLYNIPPGFSSVCSGIVPSYGCALTDTHPAAETACNSVGARLCSFLEILAGLPRNVAVI